MLFSALGIEEGGLNVAKQYVCHISGQGEKFEVVGGLYESAYVVQSARGTYTLPKSEYIICDPPEVWTDITGECRVEREPFHCTIMHGNQKLLPGDAYRLRKVSVNLKAQLNEPTQSAFIVERKKS